MNETLQLHSPAKLNLVLNIIGRREDGYHLLETAFQFIDLCDFIELTATSDGSITRPGSNSPVNETDDLMIAAARLLQQRYGTSLGVELKIEKRIPVGGGLGGGSSDAASCLLGLNQLWQLNLTLDELAANGLELGADVAVFVRGRAAWATGVGELLQPIEPELHYFLVIDPKVSVSTAEIFAAQELTRTNDPLTIRAFLQGAGSNVCEPVVRNRYPQVSAAIDWLNQYASSRMSGTGACVFAAFDSLEQADDVKSRVPEKWDAFVAKAMNVNPVHQQLGLLK